ncbi:MAG: protein kinase, partial [Myxococcales bacterium]|nr:protein kinase [Myxococcales bacterium]
MSAPAADGFCPSCEGHGAIGSPCVAATCLKRGYHHIPHAYRHVIDTRTVDPLIGQQWGDFLIVDRVGSGGVGNVYLALQQPIGLPAALKVLGQTETDDHEEQRFRAEATALARLNHPNIVRLLKFGHHEERPYLVMEYVKDGRTLKADMRRGMSAEASLSVVHQLIDALEAAHAAQVVHRDIKP